MLTDAVPLLAALLALVCGASAIGCGNVTIRNAADADAVRRDCRVIHGNLELADNLSESIDLDGLERVDGAVSHFGCRTIRDKSCVVAPPLFNISILTLTSIGKWFAFRDFHGLERLILPNLTTVTERVTIVRMNNLTYLDITMLAHVGHVELAAKNLKTLRFNGLQSFTGKPQGRNGGVLISNIGDVETLDGFFKNSLNPIFNPNNDEGSVLSFHSESIRNVRKLTLGWPKLTGLSVAGVNLTLELGGPTTSSVELDWLEIRKGVVGLERHPELKNLSASRFEIYQSDITALKLPFDQLTDVSLHGSNLRSVELPPQAAHWQNLTLWVSGCNGWNMSDESADDASGGRRKTWYWPERDIYRVNIAANISANFFQSFIEYRTQYQDTSTRPRILHEFDVMDVSGMLNCTALDKLQNETGILSSRYGCSASDKQRSAARARVRVRQLQWTWGLLAIGVLRSVL